MSVYAFDIDGTLDQPAIARLARDLFHAGHEVVIVTGGLADTGEWSEEARDQQLTMLQVPYTRLIRCIAPTVYEVADRKAAACDEVGAAIMFDDSRQYLDAFWRSTTTPVLVKP